MGIKRNEIRDREREVYAEWRKSQRYRRRGERDKVYFSSITASSGRKI